MAETRGPKFDPAPLEEINRTRARAERGCMIDAIEYIRLHNAYCALYVRHNQTVETLNTIRFDAEATLMDIDHTFGPSRDELEEVTTY